MNVSKLRMILLTCLAATTSCVGSKGTGNATSSEASTRSSPSGMNLAYPVALPSETREVLHGVTVQDPYRWLENGASGEVQSWVAREDSFSRAYLSGIPSRASFLKRLRELHHETKVNGPQRHGETFAFLRRADGDEKFSLVIDRAGKESILFNPVSALGLAGPTIDAFHLSPDGLRVTVSLRTDGIPTASIRTFDVVTGGIIDMIPDGTDDGVVWVPGTQDFYYTAVPAVASLSENDRYAAAEIRLHRMGGKYETDSIIREKTGDPGVQESVVTSPRGRWLVVRREYGDTRSELFFRDTHVVAGSWIPLAVGKMAHFDACPLEDRFFILTNEGAPRGKVLAVNPLAPGTWTSVVSERPDATLHRIYVLNNKLLLRWLRDASTDLELRDLSGGAATPVTLPGVGSAYEIDAHESEQSGVFLYESYVFPTTLFEISAKDGLARAIPVAAASHADDRFEVEKKFYTSSDGTRGPVFIVHRKGLPKDGRRPTILLGYGGFRASMYPNYDAGAIAWLENDGVYVYVSLRGGKEYGEEWHRAATGTRKQNTFNDFFAAAEALQKEGWTQPAFLAARGESNGGLLVTAAVTQRPELFAVGLARVPLTDMIRFPLSGDGEAWVSEYGSPKNAEEFAALLAYSPYHHVRRGVSYPSMLVSGVAGDEVVDGMHARKFVAALQAASSGGPVLYTVEQSGGHFGPSQVDASATADADAFAFALSQMGDPRRH